MPFISTSEQISVKADSDEEEHQDFRFVFSHHKTGVSSFSLGAGMVEFSQMLDSHFIAVCGIF